MKEKLNTFIVSVNIYEGRHYTLPNMDSYVLVRVGNKKKCTKVRPHTDCPYYNEVSTFLYIEELVQRNFVMFIFLNQPNRNNLI